HTGRRILVAPTRQASGRTRDPSPRQLPTDHDHDGELRSIREYQSDQPSMRPPRPPPAPLQRDKKGKVTSTFDRSFHIRSVAQDSAPVAPRPIAVAWRARNSSKYRKRIPRGCPTAILCPRSPASVPNPWPRS